MRAPRSTSDNRRFPAAPRTTSRPLPGRARSAAPTARKKCTGHMHVRVCVCVRSTCVCMYWSDRPSRHEGTRGTRSPTLTFTLTFTLVPDSRGCIGSRHTGLSRASGPHTIVTRSATTTREDDEGRRNDFVPPLRAAIFSVLGSLLQREMPTVRYRRSSSSIASSLSAYVRRAWKLSLSCHRPSSNCGR